MERLAATWVYLAEQPLLWLTATLLVYWLAVALHARAGGPAALNPVMLSIIALGGLLTVSDTDYRTYFDGAQFVHFLLGPATVALAVPLSRQRGRLRRHWGAITLALTAGSATAVVSALGLGWLLGLPPDTLLSLLPKSVTTPIAMGIAERVGGIPSLTAVLVILTGMVGAVAGPALLRGLGLRNPVANGFALGLSAHGIGTARAFEDGAEAGAFSGLGMGLNGALTALAVPLVVWLTGL